jgi:single-stranded-DNA-specific exonuclease
VEKRWNILSADDAVVNNLQASLKINPVICKILVQRGIDNYEKARNFFRPELQQLHSPWLMKDMEKAVDRIIKAINQEEKILVFGDYDVDGTTSVACMFQFLQKIHAPLDFYIPHRYKEGYGVSKAGIDFAGENGFTLIISLDCGIKSVDLIRYAAGLGIDFVVCDHHLPDDELPPAAAILNPKQKDCPYPYKELCGCGVGFKLITALAERLKMPAETPFEYLDLLATAIAADIVPITGENRILAYHGLIKANRNPNAGIRALIKLSGLEKELQITNLVFMIAPRVNAAGRMDDATKAVRMFIAGSESEAMEYAEMLHSDNTDRKEADSSITSEALALITANNDWKNRNSTVVYQPHWHKGVVGIVASRIIEHFYRPTVVLTQSGDYVAGSARSVPGFNLYEAIHACREHLLGYGGHFAAAGMTMERDQVDAFREKFESVVTASIKPEMLIPEIIIDAEISFKDIQQSLYNILAQMEPFGPENIRPVFITRKVMNTGWSRILKEKHIKFSLKQNHVILNGIGFGMADKFPLLEQQQPLDIIFKVDENEWKGEKSLQLQLIDFRLSDN